MSPSLPLYNQLQGLARSGPSTKAHRPERTFHSPLDSESTSYLVKLSPLSPTVKPESNLSVRELPVAKWEMSQATKHML